MEMLESFKRQYHLSFEMLRECIKKCPDDVWTSGKQPRVFWRIAYHAVYYTDRYLQQDEHSFKPWALHRPDVQALWGRPKKDEPYTKQEVLSYLDEVDSRVDGIIDHMDFSCMESGFSLYKMGKFELQLLNLRHGQGHIGQLSEILMSHGINTTWAGMSE